MKHYRHNYDIDGLARIASAVPLPELEFSRSEGPVTADLVVDRGLVGGLLPRTSRSLVLDGDGLTWLEHVGSLGGNFSIHFGDPLRVTVGPLLSVSPHVVYTNLVEPLLRFMLVRRGRVLLHAATVELKGRTVMLSAQTDTGKTSTVLRLLQRHGGTFYSDDMVIVDREGWLTSYPKPLTISAHTVRSTPHHRLKAGNRLTLPVQSRLHSRGTRAVGKRMAELNLPIMSMNAAVQAVVPPPKYMVSELVDCVIGRGGRVEQVFLIEHGHRTVIDEVRGGEAIEALLRNTEDAYGFPPYPILAAHISVGGLGHAELKRRERAILESALGQRPLTRIVAADYGWADVIVRRIGLDGDRPADAAVPSAERELDPVPDDAVLSAR
jgi:hypothetical protein